MQLIWINVVYINDYGVYKKPQASNIYVEKYNSYLKRVIKSYYNDTISRRHQRTYTGVINKNKNTEKMLNVYSMAIKQISK